MILNFNTFCKNLNIQQKIFGKYFKQKLLNGKKFIFKLEKIHIDIQNVLEKFSFKYENKYKYFS